MNKRNLRKEFIELSTKQSKRNFHENFLKFTLDNTARQSTAARISIDYESRVSLSKKFEKSRSKN